jgi:hypothetical protein
MAGFGLLLLYFSRKTLSSPRQLSSLRRHKLYARNVIRDQLSAAKNLIISFFVKNLKPFFSLIFEIENGKSLSLN